MSSREAYCFSGLTASFLAFPAGRAEALPGLCRLAEGRAGSPISQGS